MQGSPIVSVVSWVLYFGLTAGVIFIDGRIQKAKAEATGFADVVDRSPLPFMLLALVCGPLPLIVYFGATRKGAVGWLIGIGAAIGVYVVTVAAYVALSVGMAVAQGAS